MCFLVDECIGPILADWLQSQGHEVFSVYDSARGMDDNEVIQKAFEENWILITNDKDFGDQIYREHIPHHGVILLRLDDERARNKIDILSRLLISHAHRLQFVVVTEEKVRFAKQ